jgi:hypothetical protein
MAFKSNIVTVIAAYRFTIAVNPDIFSASFLLSAATSPRSVLSAMTRRLLPLTSNWSKIGFGGRYQSHGKELPIQITSSRVPNAEFPKWT